MLKRVFKAMRYAALLLKLGGPKAFLFQLRRQIYSRDILFGLETNSDTDKVAVTSRLQYSLAPASEKDIEEVVLKAETESEESAHELIQRKWFYECGFHECYMARTADTRDPCFLAWIISSKDSSVVNQGFKSRLPSLQEDELLLENCYTFEQYRGNGIMPSALSELWETAISKGFKRMITYVRQDNKASLRAFEKLGFRKFDEIRERKLLFFTKRNHN